jgi:GDP/UDP-N,N'-diacetylbacillosamine 2-epimerase (hydrolysing)
MKIMIISGSRAEFHLLKNLIIELKKNKKIKLFFGITGSHLSKFFGYTINEIKNEKIKIDAKMDLGLKYDSRKNIIKYLSKAIDLSSKFINKVRPDLMILLGDRYEIYAAAISAYFNKVPIAHIHGGEKTKGSIDDGIRHSITKFSHVHFVSNKEHLKRVTQLGENTRYIFNTGSLGVEAIKVTKLIPKKILEKELNIKFLSKNIIVTFHPETNKSIRENIKNLKILLKALKLLKDTCIIFTMSNSDSGFNSITKVIKKFIKINKNYYFFKSLGQKKFFSVCKYADMMIGNSSSGIIEMPSFKKATLNVGNRQSGRMKAQSIVDVDFSEKKIIKKIKYIYSNKFKKMYKKLKNPYEKKNSSKLIARILSKINLKDIFIKDFKDYKIK